MQPRHHRQAQPSTLSPPASHLGRPHQLDRPPPFGYDPATIYKGADHPGFGLLKLTPWRIELAILPGESESGTQKKHRKIGKKSIKISRMKRAQTTHGHPEKCVAKSERNPSKSLALTPSNQILYKPASHPAASTPTPLANRSLHALSASGCIGRRKHSGKGKPVKRLRLEFVMTPTTVLPEMT